MNHSINPRSNADERSQLEDEFARQHASDTDEQLLSYVGSIASKLGRKPTKEETIGYRYIKSRLGNWPGIMVKLGLLEPKSVRHFSSSMSTSAPAAARSSSSSGVLSS